MERRASAVWNGGLKDGKGALTTPSGVLSTTPYSFTDRFENGRGDIDNVVELRADTAFVLDPRWPGHH